MNIAQLAAHAVAQAPGKPMTRVFVTGSRVIGAHNDNSDIDVVVRVEPGHRTERALRALGDVELLAFKAWRQAFAFASFLRMEEEAREGARKARRGTD